MAKQDLLELIRWLDPAKKPLLIQGPADQLNRIEILSAPDSSGRL